MRVVSVQRGEARPHPGSPGAKTGIFKTPVESIQLGYLGVDGDAVCNTKHHGGPSKAVCVYCGDHFAHWAGRYPHADWSPGAFGENLTVSGWAESDCHLGDVLRIGSATVQVSQPRGPCGTLAARHQVEDFVKVCRAAGFTGWYLRVLEPGEVRPGDPIALLAAHPAAFTIARANVVMYADEPDPAEQAALLAIDALADSWREALAKR